MQDKQLGMLIAKIRTDSNISSRLLTKGICTPSFLNAIEVGKKDIDGFMLDYIFMRLGVSQDGYEYYQPKHKVDIINQRDNIVRLIENQEFIKAEQELDVYKQNYWNENNLHKQFILHMESRLLLINHKDYNSAYNKLKEAVLCTVSEIDNKKLFRLLIGFNELFLLVESLRLKLKVHNDVSVYEKYLEIIEYIKSSNWESLLKIRIYNKVVCLVSEYWLDKKEYEKILIHCNQAIKYIQETGKLYFISDILKLKILSLEGINNKCNSYNIDIYNIKELNNDYNSAQEWKNTIDELLHEYGAVVEPYEWQPYYNSKVDYIIGDVIKRRREMVKQDQDKLSFGVCEICTLSKIEKGIQAPQPKTARSLLRKLNISNKLYNTDLASDDYELHNIFNEINSLLSLRKNDEAIKLIDVLENRLDTSNLINKQYFIHKKTSALKDSGILLTDEAMKFFAEALYITLPNGLDLKASNNFFTKRELILVVNIAICAEELLDKAKTIELYDMLEAYYNNMNDEIKNIITYETFARNYQSFLGNIGLFEKSNVLNKKAISDCLKLRRGTSIADLLYSQAYNLKKSIEQKREMQDYEKDLYIKKLRKSYIIACIMNDEFLMNFINKRMH